MKTVTEEALSIIRSTRSITLPFYGKVEIVSQKDESPHNVVTKLDHEVEQYLRAEFKKIDPTIEFVGEEFGGSRDGKKLWLVDPIDGTMHFVRGIPFCTTMVALVEDGQVIFSAIYDFRNDIMYHAEKGKGAFEDGKRISVSDRPTNQSIVALETNQAKPANVEIRNKIRAKSLLLQTISAGYEFVLVATGKIEGRICFDPFGKDYDFAPGSLLVSEAGGTVINIGSTSYDYRNTDLIAGSRSLVQDFTEGPSAIFPITT
ncbi:MAG: inositol monophosphatase family protein [bacterium]|nr:inositol monophosphatase family protein [bacterium]